MSFANNGQQATEISRTNSFDYIFLDLGLPDIEGLELVNFFTEQLKGSRLVVISGEKSHQLMKACLQFGAVGFIPKGMDYEVMKHALNIVLSGEVFIPAEMMHYVNGVDTQTSTQVSLVQQNAIETQNQTYAASSTQIKLTSRQLEVLTLMCRGDVNKIIARKLGCAEATVKAHISVILKELAAKNRTEAVINAQKLNLVDLN
ncbi:LuxR C-terminal-related transcriptional regulator [Aliikangiella sp. IMCC44653]